jgi:hypothetical protein
MANSITYTGRLINRKAGDITFGKSRNGVAVLKLLIAEQHQGRNDRVAPKFRQNDKATDAWVNTTTTWHRITIMGDIALDIASDERFSHGTLVDVKDASYEEEDPWKMKDGTQVAGRPETIGDRKGDISVYVGRNGQEFVADELTAIWDGVSEIPDLPRGNGGGGYKAPEYGENEGL